MLARRLATQRLVGSPLPVGRGSGRPAHLRAGAGVGLRGLVARDALAPARRTTGSSPPSTPAICCGPTSCARPGTWSRRPTSAGSWRPPRTGCTSRTPACTAGRASTPRPPRAPADLLVAMLEGGRSLTRPEIGERLAAAGVAAPAGMRLTYLVMQAELDGLIVSGPLRGQQHTYALLAERLAGRPTSTPDDPVGRAVAAVRRRPRADQRAGLRPLVVAHPDRGPGRGRTGSPTGSSPRRSARRSCGGIPAPRTPNRPRPARSSGCCRSTTSCR